MARMHSHILLASELRKFRWTKKDAENIIGCDCQECLDCANDESEGGDHFFDLQVEERGTGHNVNAGCRDYTIQEYRNHVNSQYPGTRKARATLRILDKFERKLIRHLKKQLPGYEITKKTK